MDCTLKNLQVGKGSGRGREGGGKEFLCGVPAQRRGENPMFEDIYRKRYNRGESYSRLQQRGPIKNRGTEPIPLGATEKSSHMPFMWCPRLATLCMVALPFRLHSQPEKRKLRLGEVK